MELSTSHLYLLVDDGPQKHQL